MAQTTRVVAAAISLALLLGLPGCAGEAGRDPAYRVGDLQDGDEVLVTTAGREVVFDIYSKKGIGSAEIVRTGGPAPETILLRFHLSGLEELRLTYADTQVTVHVSSLDDTGVSQEVRLPGGETQAIGPGSPYWMAVRIPDDQRPALTDSRIEVTAPGAFFASDALSISLRWIDFYR